MMRFLSILLKWLVGPAILWGAANAHGQGNHDASDVYRTVLRRQGDDRVHTYRIPALTATPQGTLIAAFDVRHKDSGDLPGDIDVAMMRSTDNGNTWSPMQIVLDFDEHVPGSRGSGVGDPAVVVDQRTGRIIIAALWSFGDRAWHGSRAGLAPEETGQLVLTTSDDEGITWSEPTNITRKIAGRGKDWRLLFQGPGNGLQLDDGTLVFAAQFRDEVGTPHSCCLFSTDGGTQWAVTRPALPATPPTTEAQIAQLTAQSLLITMRDESRSGKRAFARYAWSDDFSSGSWSPPWFDVPDPTCMASLIRHPSGLLLLSNPGSARERKDLTIRSSNDAGQTWCDGRVLDSRPCAYSCMTVLSDSRIGVLYEVGEFHPYETLTFARISLDWINRHERSNNAKAPEFK